MKKSRVDLRPKTPVRKLTREEMIALVDKIRCNEGTEEEIGSTIELFDANCLHPRKNGLIFWPRCPTQPEFARADHRGDCR
jgi:hypothetical protein